MEAGRSWSAGEATAADPGGVVMDDRVQTENGDGSTTLECTRACEMEVGRGGGVGIAGVGVGVAGVVLVMDATVGRFRWMTMGVPEKKDGGLMTKTPSQGLDILQDLPELEGKGRFELEVEIRGREVLP
jgi:hypothetical protein